MGEQRNYMVLTTMTRQMAAAGKALMANIAKIDPKAKPLWFDASHVGIVLTTELPAVDIWVKALDGISDLNDALVIEIGNDWTARRESNFDHWFMTHLGTPRRSSIRR